MTPDNPGPDWKAAVDLCTEFGLPAEVMTNKHGFQWNGQTLRARLQHSDYAMASELIHELAHWLVASPKRRKMAEFGLGPGANTGQTAGIGLRLVEVDAADSLMKLTARRAEHEEEEASLLGIFFEHRLGMHWSRTLEYHNWEDYRRAVRAVQRLRKRNLLKVVYPDLERIAALVLAYLKAAEDF